MSLFGAGRDMATVFPEVAATDSYGNTVMRPAVSGVSVRGQFVFDASSEDMSSGDEVTSSGRFFALSWPSGYAGRVSFDGRDWDVVGEPQRHGGSRKVDHMVVRLRARSPRPVA